MTNSDNLVIAKCNEQLLKILTDLLQSVTRFRDCDKYYILRWIYKLRQVLQSAMIIRTMIANVHAYTIKV